MSQLAPDVAIFSPSVARLAATTARDWDYVDSWLASKYNGRDPPQFERNADTLKALLALATFNETSDGNLRLLSQVDAITFDKISAVKNPNREPDDEAWRRSASLTTFKNGFYAVFEDCLTRDGKAALDMMASSALHLGMAFPEPARLARAMLDLQTRLFDLEQAVVRVGTLQYLVESESATLQELLEDVRGDEYRPPTDLARQNLDLQRKIKAMSKKLPEAQERVSSLARMVGVPDPTIQHVEQEEERYLQLLDLRRRLEQQINEFEGLPADVHLARQQLDQLRKELRCILKQRDAVFEGLVERETPIKIR